jgi:hypothetical protein
MKSVAGMGTLMTVFSGIAALMCLLVGFQLFFLESQIGQATGPGKVDSEHQYRQWAAQAHTGAIMSLGAGLLIFLLGLRHLTATSQGDQNPPPNAEPESLSSGDLESLSVRVFEVDASDRSVEITPGEEDSPVSEDQPIFSRPPSADDRSTYPDLQTELALEGDLEPPADPTETIVQSIRDAANPHQIRTSFPGSSRFAVFSSLARLFRIRRRR